MQRPYCFKNCDGLLPKSSNCFVVNGLLLSALKLDWVQSCLLVETQMRIEFPLIDALNPYHACVSLN